MSENSEAIEVQLSVPERQYVKVYKDFLQSELLSAEEKLVFIALRSFVSYGSDAGKIFPSIDTLCRYTSMSKPRVIRTINSLVEKGVVQKKQRGLTKTNLYILSDNSAMWESKTADELKDRSKIKIQASTAELLEELKRRGIEVVTKTKELPSATVEGSDESSNGLKQFDIVKTTTKNYIGSNNQSQERYSWAYVKEQFEYDAIANEVGADDTESVFHILYDALNTKKATIRVGGEDRPTEVVIGKLMKLTESDIVFVVRKFNEQSDRIQNPNAYILTQLYRAKEQNYLDLMNEGHHNGDF